MTHPPLASGRAETLRADDTEGLRATCLHEYAHLAAARHFGACGFVTVCRARRTDTGAWAWQGRFQLFGTLADDEWRIVAIAGALAERIATGCARDAALLHASLRRPGALSASDATLASGYGLADVERCLAVVGGAWGDITGDAAERVGEIERDYARDAAISRTR